MSDKYKVGDRVLSLAMGWIRNIYKGGDGWERFDYHEEAYWMRVKAKEGE